MNTIKTHLQNAKAKWNTIAINTRHQYDTVIWPIFIEGNWIIYTFSGTPDNHTRTLDTYVKVITVNVGQVDLSRAGVEALTIPSYVDKVANYIGSELFPSLKEF